MNKLFIVDIEAVDTRYTKEWKYNIPALANEYLAKQGLQDKFEVVVIDGKDELPDTLTPGAFLNFGGTNIYKSTQLQSIANMFCNADVQSGDIFLYTDAWNPTVFQVKYMADLLNIKVKLVGMWHAGSYDPNDFLGRVTNKIKPSEVDYHWCRMVEKALFTTYDHNLFATNYHIDLMYANLLTDKYFKKLIDKNPYKVIRVGWPMEYLKSYDKQHMVTKRNLIVFPHRIAPEKQLDIFKSLEKMLPQYEFIVCQESKLTKQQYHHILAASKIVFSANLQETLGISCYEGMIHGSFPLVPDRLSYVEMYPDKYRYPSVWTQSKQDSLYYLGELANLVTSIIETHDADEIKLDSEILGNKYFNSLDLFHILFKI